MAKKTITPKRNRLRFLQFSLLSMLVLMFLSALGVKIYLDYYMTRSGLEERKLADGSVIRFQQRKRVEGVDDRNRINAGFGGGFGSEMSEYEKHGEYIVSDKHGRVLCRGRYGRDKPIGRWSIYHLNGRLAFTGAAEDTVRYGKWNGWHASGRNAVELSHALPLEEFTGETTHDKNGEIEQLFGEKTRVSNRHGRTRAWWPNGQLRLDGQFENNRRTGKWTFWNQVGLIVASGEYQAGRRQGDWQFADSQGNLRNTIFVSGHQVDDIVQLLNRLAEDIDSPDLPTFERALVTLGALGPLGVPLLAKAIMNESNGNAILALEQLTMIGPDSRETLPAIRSLATHDDPLVRAGAIAAAFAIEPAQRDEAFKQLVAVALQTSGRQQQRIFARIGSLGVNVLPHLDKLLQSDQLSDRLVALNVLNAMIQDGRFESLAGRQPDFQEKFYELIRRTADHHTDPRTARLAKLVLDNLENFMFWSRQRPFVGSIPVVG